MLVISLKDTMISMGNAVEHQCVANLQSHLIRGIRGSIVIVEALDAVLSDLKTIAI